MHLYESELVYIMLDIFSSVLNQQGFDVHFLIKCGFLFYTTTFISYIVLFLAFAAADDRLAVGILVDTVYVGVVCVCYYLVRNDLL